MSTTLSSAQTIALFQEHVVGNYTRYPVAIERGAGSLVWDAEGRRYIDFFPGWGCNLLGHCPPAIVAAVRDQVGKLIHVPNTWHIAVQGQLAQALNERSFNGRAFFCNSGAEANEAAIKLARLHGRGQRWKVVTALGSFHGRTFAALSATGQPKYQHGFAPLVPGFTHVPYGDLAALAAAVDSETCAVLVEPIQGEGGVQLPPAGYLADVRALCDRHDALMLLDEVQTGMGRTGRWFAYQHEGIVPDAMTLAKSLAGGIAAGALLCRKELADLLKPGTHAATFGGNPIACRAALAYIETVERENLLARAEWVGQCIQEALAKRTLPLVRQVRVRGAMIGIEVEGDGMPIVQAALERGLLINCTRGHVIRLLPALNVPADLLQEGNEILLEVLQNACR